MAISKIGCQFIMKNARYETSNPKIIEVFCVLKSKYCQTHELKVLHVHFVTRSNFVQYFALGIVTVQSAGNSNQDACIQGNLNALLVGATGPTDFVSDFSNYGSCVDIFAPGEALLSLSRGKHEAYIIMFMCFYNINLSISGRESCLI